MSDPVGILGGTFDPIHNAHLAMARSARAALQLRCIIWIPTGTPPYREPPIASATDRVAMLRLALAGEPQSTIDERELAPGWSGFTVDTLLAIRAESDPESRFVLLLGSDQYAKFGTWHRPEELRKLCRLAVFSRPGWPAPHGDVMHVSMSPLAISASDIRARIGRGEDVSAMLPEPVLAYIRAHDLYR